MPASLQFAFKVPEEITVASWPGHARYGTRAGQANGSFLDAGLFDRQFAGPLGPYQDRVATLIFEFGTIPRSVFATAGEFAGRLDAFLEALPGGYRYAVEVRNPEYLGPGYFATLARHGVAHVFNAWTRMPALDDQAADARRLHGRLHGVRALLRRADLRAGRLASSRRTSDRRARSAHPRALSEIAETGAPSASRPSCSSTTGSRATHRQRLRLWSSRSTQSSETKAG